MKEVFKKSYKDIVIFLFPFVIFIALLLAYYPGIITYDGNLQWSQVQSNMINDSHPFLSTYFMYLVSKIWNSPRAILVFQILIFSFFWSYMCKKTRKNNFLKQIIYTIIISFLPIISMYSITLWKDILYSYYLMMLAFLTYYYADNKKCKMDLKKAIIIGLLLFLIYSYRHNAVIVIILYIMVVMIFLLKYNKANIKKFFISIITFIILFGIISIPKKIYLNNYNEENESKIDIGMIDKYETWVLGAYLKENKISSKDKKFLNHIIDIKHWKKAYNPYLINSTFIPDKVDEKYLISHKKEYKNIFIKYVLKYPTVFIKHYLNADSLLISINSMDRGYVYIFAFSEWGKGNYGFKSITKPKLPKLEEKYTKIINLTMEEPVKYLYQPGLILYLSIGGIVYLSIKRKNKKYYLLLLPMLLNTISLLPVNLAQDLRYVYINYLTIIMIGLFFIQNEKSSINEVKKERVKMKKNVKILLIIPAYNEEKNILKTYKSIVEYNKKNNTKYDAIVINDGSIDDTKNICLKNNIPVINLIHNLGIGGAVQTGYKYAYENNYDIAIQFDGDGQHDVGSVKDIIKPILEGKSDFVIGSRFVKKQKDNFQTTFSRRIGINMISFFMKIVSKKKIYDTTSGFRACNKNIIDEFAHEYPLEYPEPITTVELIKKGYLLDEVPVKMKERIGGISSIHSWKNAYYMINVILSILIVGLRRYK